MKCESLVEENFISLLEDKGYEFIDEDYEWLKERKLGDFINYNLLFEKLSEINNIKNKSIIDEAIKKITIIDKPSLFDRNMAFHKMLIEGVIVESKDCKINPQIKFIDFDNVYKNCFQVCHQVKFYEGKTARIPDVIIYINGIPLIVMELKSFAEDQENATLEEAYRQLGSNTENDGYRYDIPTLFNYNAFLVISDGAVAKVGTLTAKIDRYNEWRSVSGERGYDNNCTDRLSVLVDGLFSKERLLDVIKNNLFFITDKNDAPAKILAQYHQYFGVLKLLKSIKSSLLPNGDEKGGILWHTQGSGKSYSMVMLAHRLLLDKKLKVPTIVVLTDRIDLDDQLSKTFFSAKDYLRCEPLTATSRKDLVEKLKNLKQGGIILTTVGKFDKDNLPKNERTNIIVMTDEAHRGHYGINETVKYVEDQNTKEMQAIFKYGVEKYIREALPNATFIGFTGTPVSTKDKQTTEIFGEIVDSYDMTQSVIDGSTVKLYYESRLAKVWLDDKKLEEIDAYYDNIEMNNLADEKSIKRSKVEMSKIKVILEDDDMIDLFARDIMKHYNDRKNFLNGKAMIVCETRIAAMKLYKKIVNEVNKEMKNQVILVITETNKDNEELRNLAGDSNYRKELGEEFKKDTSKYKIAIVCDMWLTGFDVPDLDVMYFIKKLKSYNLMQAIARVNRVYPGKTSGLIVDYIGLRKALDGALEEYTDRDIKLNIQDIKKDIYSILKEKLNVLKDWFDEDLRKEFLGENKALKFQAIQKGAEIVIADKNGKEKPFIDDLSIAIKRAFVVCSGTITEEEKNEILFYLAIRSYILKLRAGNSVVSTKMMNEYVSTLLVDAIKGDEVKVLTKNKDSQTNVIDLLSIEKIIELRKNNPPHIFIEIIRKLLERAIVESRKHNYLKSQEYSKRLRDILEKYNDRDAEFKTDLIIVELTNFAGEMMKNEEEANSLGISGRERAFYDALVKDKSVKELLNDETLKLIAHELKDVVEEYAVTDWSSKEATRAKMHIKVKECLKKYKYPPEYQENAVDNVIMQAKHATDSNY